jgi:homoserine kinase type II
MHPSPSVSQSAILSGDQASRVVTGTGREQFAAEELAVVLSHFDVGVIESVADYPRGSRKSPKALITSEQGKFLLKRRAPGKDQPERVAFSHALQLHLVAQQFPLPHLIGTRKDNNSLLEWRGGVYELFEYIAGQPYPQTLEATADAGRVLALYHKLLLDFQTQWQPGAGGYHRSAPVAAGLQRIEAATTNGANLLLKDLAARYTRAADAVDAQGLPDWPRQIVHADWHPGNMLFRQDHVVAVIDYDAARLLPRIVDVANGALQFSIVDGSGTDVAQWPDYTDETRFKRFLRGYDQVMMLSQAEARVLPWLMVEALIAEAVFPIAATGSFGRTEGTAFLQMVQRKVHWMEKHAARLTEIAEG